MQIGFIGFGEAGQAFAEGMMARGHEVAAYDVKTIDVASRTEKLADYARAEVTAAETPAAAVASAALVFSLVTADQALSAARTAAPLLGPGTLFCDMNSVAPATKRAAAALVGEGGGRYVDVAVMSPVHPLRQRAPLLVSGPAQDDALAALIAAGFNPRGVDGGVGAASAIKMIRSIMVKGMEALTAECILSAVAAGVEDEVLASLDASYPGFDWPRKADYNLDRMLVHGRRRAAEMDESAATARSLGQGGTMAAATAGWQRRIGELGLVTPPAGLYAKARAILAGTKHA